MDTGGGTVRRSAATPLQQLSNSRARSQINAPRGLMASGTRIQIAISVSISGPRQLLVFFAPFPNKSRSVSK